MPDILKRSGTFSRLWEDTLSITLASPSLGNPRELIIPSLVGTRKIRGCGFPSRGLDTMVPPVIYPKPIFASDSSVSQFLSYPAARPTGFGRSIVVIRVLSRGSC